MSAQMRDSRGRYSSPETMRRRQWAEFHASRSERRDPLLPGIGSMSFCEHLGACARRVRELQEMRREGRL